MVENQENTSSTDVSDADAADFGAFTLVEQPEYGQVSTQTLHELWKPASTDERFSKRRRIHSALAKDDESKMFPALRTEASLLDDGHLCQTAPVRLFRSFLLLWDFMRFKFLATARRENGANICPICLLCSDHGTSSTKRCSRCLSLFTSTLAQRYVESLMADAIRVETRESFLKAEDNSSETFPIDGVNGSAASLALLIGILRHIFHRIVTLIANEVSVFASSRASRSNSSTQSREDDVQAILEKLSKEKLYQEEALAGERPRKSVFSKLYQLFLSKRNSDPIICILLLATRYRQFRVSLGQLREAKASLYTSPVHAVVSNFNSVDTKCDTLPIMFPQVESDTKEDLVDEGVVLLQTLIDRFASNSCIKTHDSSLQLAGEERLFETITAFLPLLAIHLTNLLERDKDDVLVSASFEIFRAVTHTLSEDLLQNNGENIATQVGLAWLEQSVLSQLFKKNASGGWLTSLTRSILKICRMEAAEMESASSPDEISDVDSLDKKQSYGSARRKVKRTAFPSLGDSNNNADATESDSKSSDTEHSASDFGADNDDVTNSPVRLGGRVVLEEDGALFRVASSYRRKYVLRKKKFESCINDASRSYRNWAAQLRREETSRLLAGDSCVWGILPVRAMHHPEQWVPAPSGFMSGFPSSVAALEGVEEQFKSIRKCLNMYGRVIDRGTFMAPLSLAEAWARLTRRGSLDPVELPPPYRDRRALVYRHPYPCLKGGWYAERAAWETPVLYIRGSDLDRTLISQGPVTFPTSARSRRSESSLEQSQPYYHISLEDLHRVQFLQQSQAKAGTFHGRSKARKNGHPKKTKSLSSSAPLMVMRSQRRANAKNDFTGMVTRTSTQSLAGGTRAPVSAHLTIAPSSNSIDAVAGQQEAEHVENGKEAWMQSSFANLTGPSLSWQETSLFSLGEAIDFYFMKPFAGSLYFANDNLIVRKSSAADPAGALSLKEAEFTPVEAARVAKVAASPQTLEFENNSSGDFVVWSEGEIAAFILKFLTHGKDFRRVAAAVSATVGQRPSDVAAFRKARNSGVHRDFRVKSEIQCAEFYYRFKFFFGLKDGLQQMRSAKTALPRETAASSGSGWKLGQRRRQILRWTLCQRALERLRSHFAELADLNDVIFSTNEDTSLGLMDRLTEYFFAKYPSANKQRLLAALTAHTVDLLRVPSLLFFKQLRPSQASLSGAGTGVLEEIQNFASNQQHSAIEGRGDTDTPELRDVVLTGTTGDSDGADAESFGLPSVLPGSQPQQASESAFLTSPMQSGISVASGKVDQSVWGETPSVAAGDVVWPSFFSIRELQAVATYYSIKCRLLDEAPSRRGSLNMVRDSVLFSDPLAAGCSQEPWDDIVHLDTPDGGYFIPQSVRVIVPSRRAVQLRRSMSSIILPEADDTEEVAPGTTYLSRQIAATTVASPSGISHFPTATATQQSSHQEQSHQERDLISNDLDRSPTFVTVTHPIIIASQPEDLVTINTLQTSDLGLLKQGQSAAIPADSISRNSVVESIQDDPLPPSGINPSLGEGRIDSSLFSDYDRGELENLSRPRNSENPSFSPVWENSISAPNLSSKIEYGSRRVTNNPPLAIPKSEPEPDEGLPAWTHSESAPLLRALSHLSTTKPDGCTSNRNTDEMLVPMAVTGRDSQEDQLFISNLVKKAHEQSFPGAETLLLESVAAPRLGSAARTMEHLLAMVEKYRSADSAALLDSPHVSDKIDAFGDNHTSRSAISNIAALAGLLSETLENLEKTEATMNKTNLSSVPAMPNSEDMSVPGEFTLESSANLTTKGSALEIEEARLKAEPETLHPVVEQLGTTPSEHEDIMMTAPSMKAEHSVTTEPRATTELPPTTDPPAMTESPTGIEPSIKTESRLTTESTPEGSAITSATDSKGFQYSTKAASLPSATELMKAVVDRCANILSDVIVGTLESQCRNPFNVRARLAKQSRHASVNELRNQSQSLMNDHFEASDKFSVDHRNISSGNDWTGNSRNPYAAIMKNGRIPADLVSTLELSEKPRDISAERARKHLLQTERPSGHLTDEASNCSKRRLVDASSGLCEEKRRKGSVTSASCDDRHRQRRSTADGTSGQHSYNRDSDGESFNKGNVPRRFSGEALGDKTELRAETVSDGLVGTDASGDIFKSRANSLDPNARSDIPESLETHAVRQSQLLSKALGVTQTTGPQPCSLNPGVRFDSGLVSPNNPATALWGLNPYAPQTSQSSHGLGLNVLSAATLFDSLSAARQLSTGASVFPGCLPGSAGLAGAAAAAAVASGRFAPQAPTASAFLSLDPVSALAAVTQQHQQYVSALAAAASVPPVRQAAHHMPGSLALQSPHIFLYNTPGGFAGNISAAGSANHRSGMDGNPAIINNSAVSVQDSGVAEQCGTVPARTSTKRNSVRSRSASNEMSAASESVTTDKVDAE